MRFSTVSLLALPLLATASQQESPLEQAKAQAQYWFDKISSYIPNPNKEHPVEDAAANIAGRTVKTLTLNNWESTIRSSVKPDSATPEEWWILLTGGNKTCFGLCHGVETAFNETAALWTVKPNTPHLALLNCDDQPVLCSSWGAGPPNLWMLQVPAPPAPVDIRIEYLNTTTTSIKTFTDLQSTGSWKQKHIYEGYFHPFDGPLAQFGLAVPVGYFFWVMSVVPSWIFMIGISFISRTIITTPPRQAAAPGTAAPAAGAGRVRVGAPPGDGVKY
ncbi:hypothetical protein B7494_g8010 [Chlorociboria aeruginascens]|nr:hypothetical protein B7494_g8010 [Chlorociboria aeruginascens]